MKQDISQNPPLQAKSKLSTSSKLNSIEIKIRFTNYFTLEGHSQIYHW